MTVEKDKNEKPLGPEYYKDITSNTSNTTGGIPTFTTGDGDSSSSSDKKPIK